MRLIICGKRSNSKKTPEDRGEKTMTLRIRNQRHATIKKKHKEVQQSRGESVGGRTDSRRGEGLECH